jgi:hypothetical protein
MAALSTRVQSNMVIKFKAGLHEDGNDIIKGQRFSKLKVTSADEDILLIGGTLGQLLENEVVEIVREDQSIIVNQ